MGGRTGGGRDPSSDSTSHCVFAQTHKRQSRRLGEWPVLPAMFGRHCGGTLGLGLQVQQPGRRHLPGLLVCGLLPHGHVLCVILQSVQRGVRLQADPIVMVLRVAPGNKTAQGRHCVGTFSLGLALMGTFYTRQPLAADILGKAHDEKMKPAVSSTDLPTMFMADDSSPISPVSRIFPKPLSCSWPECTVARNLTICPGRQLCITTLGRRR